MIQVMAVCPHNLNIPSAIKRLKQKISQSKASLDYMMRFYLKEELSFNESYPRTGTDYNKHPSRQSRQEEPS